MSFDHLCNGYACKCVTVVDDDPESFPEPVAMHLNAASIMTPIPKPAPWVAPPVKFQPATQYPVVGPIPLMPPRSAFPTQPEIQAWQKTRDAIDWERRTGGINTKPELTAAYMDMASELYGLVAVIDVLAQQIAQLQTNPRAGALRNGTIEKCYWCGNQRTSGVPCTHCGRP